MVGMGPLRCYMVRMYENPEMVYSWDGTPEMLHG